MNAPMYHVRLKEDDNNIINANGPVDIISQYRIIRIITTIEAQTDKDF